MKIAFTGDIAFSKYFSKAYENERLLDDKIIDFLQDSYLTVANVEAPVSSREISSKEALVHVNHPRIVETLNKINAKVWNLANNHACDCGAKGLEDTLKMAQAQGVMTIGAGLDLQQAKKTIIIEKDSIKVGLISVASPLSERATNNKEGCFMWDEFRLIKKSIRQLKVECDHVVVISHGGEEFTQIPLPFQRDKYRKYLSWGADIVIGHHPHVPQNYERIGNKIIFYSLGNFIFDTDYQRNQRNTDIGVLVKIHFTKSDYTFTSLSIKIDRKENRIVESQPLFIFKNIDGRQYKKLISLAEIDYSNNLRSKFNFIGQTDNTKNNFAFFKAKLKRFAFSERWGIIKVILARPLKKWKKCDKETVDYIIGK